MMDPEGKYFYEWLGTFPKIYPEKKVLRFKGDKLVLDNYNVFEKSRIAPTFPYLDVSNDKGIRYNKIILLCDGCYLVFYPEYEFISSDGERERCSIIVGKDIYLKNNRLYNGRVCSSSVTSFEKYPSEIDSVSYVDIYRTDDWIIKCNDISNYVLVGIGVNVKEGRVYKTTSKVISAIYFNEKEEFDKFCNDNNISLENVIRYYGDPDSIP